MPNRDLAVTKSARPGGDTTERAGASILGKRRGAERQGANMSTCQEAESLTLTVQILRAGEAVHEL